MPDAKSQPEPSMEEIIASISRIIAEDKPQADKRAAEPALGALDESDVLELTEAVNEDGSVRRVIPLGQSARTSSTKPEATGENSVPTATARVEPEPPHAHSEIEPTLDRSRERIVSAATAGAAAAAFAQLGALPRERRHEGELPVGGGERTLEDIVRDLLRPLLQAWLDEHLPGIVERLVRDEISRVVGEAGLR
jgi:cell pole-organizing protein PopZ